MNEVTKDLGNAAKDAEAAALAKVNHTESWLKTHRTLLIAGGVGAVLAVIVMHLL